VRQIIRRIKKAIGDRKCIWSFFFSTIHLRTERERFRISFFSVLVFNENAVRVSRHGEVARSGDIARYLLHYPNNVA